jgi:hypothetical protein
VWVRPFGVSAVPDLRGSIAGYTVPPGDKDSLEPHLLSRILVYGVRSPFLRRLLGRMGWPKPHHFDGMKADVFEAYVKAVGLDASIRAAVSQRAGGTDQRRTEPPVRESEERARGHGDAPVA